MEQRTVTSEYVLQRDFGMTKEQEQQLLEAQGFRCPGCGRGFNRTRPSAIDHAHLSGLVRGAPCQICNHEIGFHQERLEWFCNIAHYLADPPAPKVLGRIYVPGSPGAEGLFDAES